MRHTPIGDNYKRFDWASWHRRGLELAKEMRKQLPSSVDLWYEHPFEEHVLQEPMLIIKK